MEYDKEGKMTVEEENEQLKEQVKKLKEKNDLLRKDIEEKRKIMLDAEMKIYSTIKLLQELLEK